MMTSGESSGSESDGMVQLSPNFQITQSLGLKKRRLTSTVWQHFEFLPVGEDGKSRAKCKKCGTVYVCGGRNGTKNMKRHLERVHSNAIQVYAREKDKLQVMLDEVPGRISLCSGRVLNQYRSTLKPEVVEALICIRDWLHGTQDVEQLAEELSDDLISLDIE